jgi:transposase
MEAMTKHRSHSAAFKRQVAEEFITGETLHALSKRHDISRQLIRIWVGKFEAGALDDDARAADLIQEFEAKIAALERMVGRQALEIELLKGASKHTRRREARPPPSSRAPRHLCPKRMRADGPRTIHLLRCVTCSPRLGRTCRPHRRDP